MMTRDVAHRYNFTILPSDIQIKSANNGLLGSQMVFDAFFKIWILSGAFITPDSHYEFLRLPFGLKNAPSHLSKLMFQALGDLKFVKIYLDAITIHSPDFHSNVDHISQVLQRLQKANLRLKMHLVCFTS
jgi:hypothetical protein